MTGWSAPWDWDAAAQRAGVDRDGRLNSGALPFTHPRALVHRHADGTQEVLSGPQLGALARRTADVLRRAGVKPGDKVVDFMMGGGYFTDILAPAVGPKGRVYAYQSAEFIAFRAAYGDEQKAAVAGRDNVVALTAPLSAVGLPDGLDLVLTVQNYHDLHLKPFPATTAANVNAQVFKALKPGGVYLVVDHAALAGAPLDTADKLHRIDPAIVKTEVEAAGFKFEGESPLLRDAADPKTALVFDPSIRGKTDQFIYKFRKPK